MSLNERARNERVWPGGYRETLRVAMPLIVSMGSYTIMQFTDRLFLAWYDKVSIQAALPAGILSFTFICLFMSLAGYAGTFVAQYHGAGDHEGSIRSTVQGLWLGALSWPVLLAMIPVGRWLLRVSGHPPAVLHAELTFFTILMLGSVHIPLSSAIGGFFTGRGDTVTNMWANVVANLVNVVLDYGLIFGKLGLPRLGIAGAALANVVAGFVAPIILFAIYLGPRLHREYGTRTRWRMEPRLMGRLARFGLPSGFQILSDVGSFTVFVLITGRLGGESLAASNIALSINNLAFMPLLGMSMAASILVGQYQGRRQSDVAERAGWTALKLGAIYMVLIGATFVLFPRQYFALYGARAGGVDAAALVPVGRWLLLMMAGWGLLDTVNLVISGGLKGAGDTRFVMLYMVAVAWFLWLPGELLILHHGGGILAAWFWMMLYVIILSVGFIWRWRRGRWKSIELIERPVIPLPLPHEGAEALLRGE
jgi:multidrug resistance protein, MATE family